MLRLRCLFAAMLIVAPGAGRASLLQLSFTGQISSIPEGNPTHDPTFIAAFPIGLAVTVSIAFDSQVDTGGSVPATGLVSFGGVAYTARTASVNGGIGPFPGGQVYSFLSVELNGPTIASPNADVLPGVPFLSLGLPYPDPLTSPGILGYPYNDVGTGFSFAAGNGGYANYARLTLTSGSVTAAIPEPASLVLLLPAAAAIVRRRRQAV